MGGGTFIIHIACTEAHSLNSITSPLLFTDDSWDLPSYSGSAGSAANGGNTCSQAGRPTDNLRGPVEKAWPFPRHHR